MESSGIGNSGGGGVVVVLLVKARVVNAVEFVHVGADAVVSGWWW